MDDFATRRTAMVDTQVRPSDVTKFPIIEAMLTVAKEEFVPDELRTAAYLGENLAIGEGRVILEPRTFGKMLDLLDISVDETVLDIGCGLGYSSAVLARMAAAVVAIEDDEDTAADAQARLSRAGADNVAVMAGPLAEGDAKHQPYDVIIIEGGVEKVPAEITNQLRDGGRICAIFIEDALGTCRIGHKNDGVVSWRFGFNAGAPVLHGFERKHEFAL